jgi:hypothetical protein
MKEKSATDRKLGYQKVTGQYMSSSMRATCREGFQLALPNIIAIAKGDVEGAPHHVQVQALNVIGKYAIGERPIMMFENSEWLEIVGRVSAKYIESNEKLKAWHEDLQSLFVHQL